MKKILSMILVFLMFLSLCACSDKLSLETENYKPSYDLTLEDAFCADNTIEITAKYVQMNGVPRNIRIAVENMSRGQDNV